MGLVKIVITLLVLNVLIMIVIVLKTAIFHVKHVIPVVTV